LLTEVTIEFKNGFQVTSFVFSTTYLQFVFILLDATSGTTIAGQSTVAGAWSYMFNLPTAITFDQYENMFIMDAGNNRIQRWSPGAAYGITVVSATFSAPRGMTIDSIGNLVVADMSNDRIVSFAMTCRKFNDNYPIFVYTFTVCVTLYKDEYYNIPRIIRRDERERPYTSHYYNYYLLILSSIFLAPTTTTTIAPSSKHLQKA
jgi:hypothetical protein